MATPIRLALMALLICGCTVQVLTVTDIEGKQYTSMEDLSNDFECAGGMLGTFDLGSAETLEAARAVATTGLQMHIRDIAARPAIDEVIDAGGVWLIANETGLIVAAVANPSGFFAMCAPESP